MSSAAKIAANRNNAHKSTGPKTDRGKGKSKLNALTHGIYATTPVVPGENVDAYRELAKLNQEYFAPVGPVENMLVHQINTEQWKLRRIERAEIAFLEEIRANDFEEFLRELNDSEFCGVRSLLTQEYPEKIVQQYEAEARSINSALVKQDVDPAENAEKMHLHIKRHIEDKLKPFLAIDNTISSVVISKSENGPQDNLDRERRTTMRVYLAYVEKLKGLQEDRLTLTLVVQPVTKAAKLGTAKPADASVPEEAANQNQLDGGKTSKAASAPRPRSKSS